MTKKLKIFGLSLLSLFAASCGESEDVLYNPNGTQSLIYFDVTSGVLAIPRDGGDELEVLVHSSSLSPVNRVITIEIDEELSTADPLNYSVPATVTIPANAYTGKFTITTTDVTAEPTREILVLSLTNVQGDASSIISNNSKTMEFGVYEYCPLDAEFSGNYLIEQTSTIGGDGPTLSSGQVVNVTATSATARTFKTNVFPNACGNTVIDFNFSLLCQQVIVGSFTAGGCRCNNPAAPTYFFGPATTPEVYDADDDSVFFVTFTDDVTSNCSPPVQTTYKFTKQ